MYFRMLEDPVQAAVTYLLADLERGEAVLIDPRARDLPLLRAMLSEQHLAAVAVLRTHAHAETPMSEDCACALGCAPRVPDDGAVLPFGDQHLRALATPGHTAGCVSYAWSDRIFCGDLLSVRECPERLHPECPQALWDSAQRLFRWPAETLLFPAHAPRGRGVSTVAEQRRTHPWLATPSRDECLRRLAADMALPPTQTPPRQEVPA